MICGMKRYYNQLLVFVYAWQYLNFFQTTKNGKNTELDSKMNLLSCMGAKLHSAEVQEPVEGVGV